MSLDILKPKTPLNTLDDSISAISELRDLLAVI